MPLSLHLPVNRAVPSGPTRAGMVTSTPPPQGWEGHLRVPSYLPGHLLLCVGNEACLGSDGRACTAPRDRDNCRLLEAGRGGVLPLMSQGKELRLT